MSTSLRPTGHVDGGAHPLLVRTQASTSVTSMQLDSAYTYGSAGDALYMGIIAPVTGNLTELHIYVSAIAGTGSTDGNLNWEIREGFNGNRIPGTTLVASGTIALSGTAGWKSATGLSVALTAGVIYLLVIGDADGDGTNNATVRVGVSGAPGAGGAPLFAEVATSTNGFSTTGTQTGRTASLAFRLDGSLYGGTFMDNAATGVASGTLARGSRFRLPMPATLVGVGASVDPNNLFAGGTWKLFADATAPDGSALKTWTRTATTFAGATIFPQGSYFLDDTVDLDANVWYRLVWIPAISTTTPRQLTGPSSPPSEVIEACFPFAGDFHWTHEVAGPAWSDNTSALPNGMFPILYPRDAAGGGALVIGG